MRNMFKRCAGIVFLVCLLFVARNASAQSMEQIRSFNVSSKINLDGTVDVIESISYDFGGNQKHGILRFIPLSSPDGPFLKIKFKSVTDENSIAYTVKNESSLQEFRVRVGDPEKLVSGVKKYNIAYTVSNVIRRSKDSDEWYWNVLGTGWAVPVNSAKITIDLPSEISADKAEPFCYTGKEGSKESACMSQKSGNSITVSTLRSLSSGEDLTISMGMPVGIIQNPAKISILDRLKILAPYVLYIVTGILVLILGVLIVLNSRKIIIPRKLKSLPIAPIYNPPDNLSPADIGVFLNGRFDQDEIAPIFIDLAVRGYLKIRYLEQKGLLGTSADYELVKQKSGEDLAHPAYKAAYNRLFGTRDSVLISGFKSERNANALFFSAISESVMNYVLGQGYIIKKSPGIKIIIPLAWFAVVAVLFRLEFLTLAIFLAVLGLLFLVIFGKTEFTEKGIETMRLILGFRDFLKLAESEKLRLLNAPALQPEMFERFLPYAMIFGLEKEWAEQFTPILKEPPKWMEDRRFAIGAINAVGATQFNTTDFVKSLNNFNSAFKDAFRSSSSNFGSGRGGAGGSGHGSGGGGGGSW